MLRRNASAYGPRVAITSEGGVDITYAELERVTNSLANALAGVLVMQNSKPVFQHCVLHHGVENGITVVLFAQRGWKEPVEFMHFCSTKWATYLLSLKSLCETGTGTPYPDDVNIG